MRPTVEYRIREYGPDYTIDRRRRWWFCWGPWLATGPHRFGPGDFEGVGTFATRAEAESYIARAEAERQARKSLWTRIKEQIVAPYPFDGPMP